MKLVSSTPQFGQDSAVGNDGTQPLKRSRVFADTFSNATTEGADAGGGKIKGLLGRLKQDVFSKGKKAQAGADDAAEATGKGVLNSLKAFKQGSVLKGLTRLVTKSLSPRGIAEWAVAIMTGFTVPLPLKHFVEGYFGYNSLIFKRRLPRPISNTLAGGSSDSLLTGLKKAFSSQAKESA